MRWTCTLSEKGEFPFKSERLIKVLRCQTGATTKPLANKEIWDYTIRDWFSDDFDHLPTNFPSPTRCGEVPLLLYVECCVYRPVGSQPAAEWMSTDSPCIWPIVPALGLGLESFLLAAPGAAAQSKTSLLGCCRPSVWPWCSGRSSPLHCSYVAWNCAVWKDDVQSYYMGTEIIKKINQ